MDPVSTLLVTLIVTAFALAILYFIIKGAVKSATTESLRLHAKWMIANREALEEKWARKD